MTAPLPTRRATVVDDDRWLLEMMEEMLATEGWEVSGFLACTDAAELVANRPDLLIVDQRLGPDSMSGEEIIGAVRAMRGVERTPIILCSGILDGVVDYDDDTFYAARVYPLPKPFSMQDLRDAVAQATAVSTADGEPAPLELTAG